ncbi:MAG TPA: pseudouridine synthase, partial [Myxococcaceae bacterium]|nr:pseudouridine synthase [Myxococcaceae bacterium]
MSERLQKFLARAGVASRRHAEVLITDGRVSVNNQRVTELGTKVEPSDLVMVDGKLVTAPESTSWYLLHKPPGVVTTLSDPEGRPTVAGFLDGVEERVFPVGRLDWDAEGALLLTNDGAAAHRLLHPSFEVPRTYLVKVKGTPTDETLSRLLEGVRLEDGPARALRAERFEATERNTWILLQVGEGRPHLVKRLCAAVGHPVVRLFRPAQAGISVAGLQPGEIRPLSAEEIARVEGVAGGTEVPEPAPFLPPRRHGRAGEDDEGLEESGPEARMGGAPEGAAGDRPSSEGASPPKERGGRARRSSGGTFEGVGRPERRGGPGSFGDRSFGDASGGGRRRPGGGRGFGGGGRPDRRAGARSFEDGAAGGDRPRRPRSTGGGFGGSRRPDRGAGARSFGDRQFGGGSGGRPERRPGSRSFGDRPSEDAGSDRRGAARSGRGFGGGGRPDRRGGRSFGGRQFGGASGERPERRPGSRSFGDRPPGDAGSDRRG